MAVYTKITDADVSAYLLQYDIGELHSLKGIAEGIQNSNYFLATSKDRYLLTLYEQMVRQQDLPFYLGLMEHLSNSGINCPQPLTMNNGQILSKIRDRPAAIVSFLNGVSLSEPGPRHCRQVGAILAKIHLGADNFPLRLDNALGQKKWRNQYKKSGNRVVEISTELPQTVEQELDYLEANWPDNLPTGVIHADLFPDNVFFLNNQLTGVIDFYFAANDLLAFDIAICINAWCFGSDGKLNRNNSDALVAGYCSIRMLEKAEIEALPLLCRGAAMRFLVTRIYDWLNVPPGAIVVPHDPLIYLERLKFHQAVSDAGEYYRGGE